MAGSIIPAIATTNAMVAGLCVLQALNVIRADYDKAKTTFLANSIDRVLSSEPLRPPHPTCVVCSVAQEKLTVDTGRATVGNLVSFLRSKLEYGDELSISSTEGVIYDPELEDNLTKKFADLGIVGNTFLTIVDEEEEEPHVDLSVFISHK